MIDTAMILAAGLGTRMRPITNTLPKPLVRINNIALIDHKLEALRRARITKAVINVHYLADKIEDHLQSCKDIEIVICDEREQLLNSGGGIANALGHFNNKPILVLNCDVIWHGDKTPNITRLINKWDARQMDLLMGLASVNKAIGFDGAGDFFMDENHLLTRRADAASAPWAFSGEYIIHPDMFQAAPKGPFSSNLLFDRAIEKNRLKGIELDGLWLHVGTPQSVIDAERAIALYGS